LLAQEIAMSLRPLHRLLPVLVALCITTAPLAAQTPEPADLLPVSTLISLEVRHPGKLAREALATIKGTALEDMHLRLAKLRTEHPRENFFGGERSLGFFSLFFSPEAISELGRFQGAAVALTGFDKQGNPEIVGLIHTGDSNLPGFFMRGQLSFESARLVDEVEKVGIYRESWFHIGPNDPMPRRDEFGPYMVLLPGVIALTSSKESARDVILRYKSKATQPALSSIRAFRDARELRERPGLFLAFDVAGFTAQLDAAAKVLGPAVKTPWDQLKLIVEPRAVTRLDGSLTLHEGDLEFLGVAKLNPAFKSPIVELLPKKPLKLGSLAGISSQAWGTITMGVEDPEAKFKMVMGVIDAVALSLGVAEDEVPSKQVPTVEKFLGFEIAKDVLGRIEEATFAFDQSRALPVTILQARDEEAAKFLQDKALPQLLLLANGGKGEIKQEERKGQTVKLYPTGQASARTGNLVVFGSDAGSVADQLTLLGKKDLWLSGEKNAAALKKIGDAEVLLTVAPRALPLAIAVLDNSPGLASAMSVYLDPSAEGVSADVAKFIRLIRTTLDTMHPVVFRIVHEGDTYRMQGRLDGVRATAPKLIDAVINQAIELERQRRQAEKKP
jgi:hypothetical protein